MSEPFVGEIRLVGFNFAPRGWMFCNGQLLPIAQYTALFSLLGTTYGGNGQSNFALPNMQGRVPMHFGQSAGTSNYVLGEVGGVESTTLTQNQMPVHTHPGAIQVSTEDATLKSPAGAWLATPGGSTYFNSTDGSTLNGLQIGGAGGSQPFDIQQPFLVVNFIIAINGIFPSRN